MSRDPAQPRAEPMERDSPHSAGHRAARLAWGMVYALLFRPSPRNLHRWRNGLLRLFGARLHPQARVYPRARVWAPWNLEMEEGATIADDVDVYSAATIRLGAYALVSQHSFLCAATHDFENVRFPLIARPITIGRRAWVAADVFVGPGVTIGEGTVVGARSAVFRDLPPWVVASGTPARPTRARRIGPADFGEARAAPAATSAPAASGLHADPANAD
jgi:putative colanic acid biosynthesis acetyltransferase WcaF